MPTDVSLRCDWGDGTTAPDGQQSFSLASPQAVVDGNKEYSLDHAYAEAGAFDVSCTMSNRVSSLTMDKKVKAMGVLIGAFIALPFIQITILDRVLEFEVTPKYVVGSQLGNPKGPGSDHVQR